MSRRLLYFPGCSVRSRYPEFEESSLRAAKEFGVELVEMPAWNCCGAVLPLVREKYFQYLAPLRVLARASEAAEYLGLEPKLVTLCSLCYNTLKLAAKALKEDEELAKRASEFIEEELGEIEVVHLAQVLAEALDRYSTPHSLDSVTVAAYYGCRLLRPKEVAIDDPAKPTVLERLLRAAGIAVTELPLKAKCCGSFHSATEGELVSAARIVSRAAAVGANVIAVVCPLCHYNLSSACDGGVRVAYFTELLVGDERGERED